MPQSITRGIARVIGEVLGAHYFSHRRIEARCSESGFTGDPPQGNCSDKITFWITREAAAKPDEIVGMVASLIEEFMDSDHSGCSDGQERIRKILGTSGLSYQRGGQIFGAAVSVAARTLDELLRHRSIPEIETEFQRAIKNMESDPPAALTAACAILETFCRIYLQEEGLALPSDQSAKPLWNAVAQHIGFAPAAQIDQDIKKVLSGFLSVVDGIASLRTHEGSAHGREKRWYKIEPRHARLAIHAAHTLVLFGLETWTARRSLQ